MARLKAGFETWHREQICRECGDVHMSVIGRDGMQVYCPECWVPVPVPAEFRFWSQRLALGER